MRTTLIPVLFYLGLSACDADIKAAENSVSQETAPVTENASQAAKFDDTSGSEVTGAQDNDACSEQDESPCPLVGRWKIVAVFDPNLTGSERLSDPNSMKGATFSLFKETDSGGTLKFDGPDTGQFNVTQQCDMPYLDKKGAKTPKDATDLLQKALAAFRLPAAQPDDIRKLACESGHWSTSLDSEGYEAVFVKPTSDRLVISWLGNVVLQAERDKSPD
jgi:hypothetical protein